MDDLINGKFRRSRVPSRAAQFQHVAAGVSSWQDVGPLWVDHIMLLSPTQSSWPAVFDSDGNQTAESKFKVKTLGNLTLLSGN